MARGAGSPPTAMRALLVAALLLAATTAAGCTDKLTSLGADGGTLEKPAFTLTPESGGKDTEFVVDAGDLGKKYNITWDWGDGVLTYGASSSHVYGFTNGEMTITLLAKGDEGQGIALKTVKLGTGKNADPSVTVRAQKTWIEARKPVNLTATGRDTDRDPLTYLWTYSVLEGGAAGADGHGHDHGGTAAPAATGQEFVLDGTGPKTSAIFESAGKYLVKVRASDPKGGEATAETTIDVSSKIPDAQVQTSFEGTIGAGTAGAGLSEKLWDPPAGDAPDTNVDAVRHPFELLYPASVLILLQWNDTAASQTGASASDLDLEMRNKESGETVFKSETRIQPGAPPVVPPALEYNFTQVPAGTYDIIIRGFAGAQVTYVVNVFATLQLTPELVAAVEGSG